MLTARKTLLAIFTLAALTLATHAPLVRAQSSDAKRDRITDRKKGESRGKSIARLPIRIATAPLWLLDRGLYYGLRTVEEENLIPRTLFLRDRLAERGLFPMVGGAGDGAGFGGGIAWLPLQGGITPTLTVSASVKGYQDHGIGLDFSEALGEGLSLETMVRYRAQPQEDFFGLGPTSREVDRSSYHHEEITAAVEFAALIAGPLRVGSRIEYSKNNIFDGEDDRFPTTQERFAVTGLSGLDDGAELVSGDVALTLDLRDHPGDATAGGLVRVSVGVGEDVSGESFGFWRYTGEVQGFVPLLGFGNRFGPRSHLAVRLVGEFHNPRSGGGVPFFRLPTVGGSSTLRGFREFRFADENAVVANIEYRWRIQSILQAVLFVDEGQVFSDSDDFELSSFRESFGGGVRVAFQHNVYFRIEVGRSSEGTRTFTKFSFMF